LGGAASLQPPPLVCAVDISCSETSVTGTKTSIEEIYSKKIKQQGKLSANRVFKKVLKEFRKLT
jgi:hypothetical protein